MHEKRKNNPSRISGESVFAQNSGATSDDPTQANWYALYLVIKGGKTKKGKHRSYTVDEALATMGCWRRSEDADC